MIYTNFIEDRLAQVCKNYPSSEKLVEIFEYALLDGGKRIRPNLCLMTYALFSDQIGDVLDFAVAIELIHNYSLVHDDLPSMDDDDYRRGKESVHKKFGEALGILAGDGMLNTAFQLMSQDILKSPKTLIIPKVKAMDEIGKRAGVKGMIYGQVLDIGDHLEKPDDLIEMYLRKTGDLMAAGILSGAIIGKAEEKSYDLLKNFSNNYGLLFQLTDDFGDFEDDLSIGKKTYLTEIGIETGKAYLDTCAQNCKEILSSLRELGYETIEFENLLGITLDQVRI